MILMVCLFLTACSESKNNMTQVSDPPAEPEANIDILAYNLKVPWSVTTDGETFYVSERAGHIVTIKGQEVSRKKLYLTEQVHHHGEGGFLGLELDPHFKENSLIYAYHTYQKGGNVYNRVIQLKETKRGWVEQRVLLDQIPGGAIHNGGRIKIGPDQKLYVTTGDANNQEVAQKRTSLAGKILRMELDGRIPADNPFPNSYVYSLGHRNPQGLAWAEDGTMYSSEHGPSGNPYGHDEINLITAGSNYGWPRVIGDQEAKGMTPPLFHSGKETWAPSGMAYHNQKLFVTGLRGEHLRVFFLDEQTSASIFSGKGRLRDVMEKDGQLYILTNNSDGRGKPQTDDDLLLRVSISTFPK